MSPLMQYQNGSNEQKLMNRLVNERRNLLIELDRKLSAAGINKNAPFTDTQGNVIAFE
jgi:hypothetical protein